MSKKAIRSKDAGQTGKSESATLERAKREARKVIQQNIARIEQAEARTSGDQSREPQQPQAHQQKPDQAREPAARARPTFRTEREPLAHRETAPGVHGPEGSPKAEGGKAGKPRRGKKTATAKAAKAPKPAKPPKAKKVSCLDAAAQIIGKDPIGCEDLIAEMGRRGLWKSPSGKTPGASLYAAIIREISAKKSEARFKKVDRGLFIANPTAKRA